MSLELPTSASAWSRDPLTARLAVVLSDQLGGLTVAFRVAGAGIAIALQEVIASAAGWVAVSFGGRAGVGARNPPQPVSTSTCWRLWKCM